MGAAAVSLGLIITNPLGNVGMPTMPSLPSIPSITQSGESTKVPAVSAPKKVDVSKSVKAQGYDFEGASTKVQADKAKAADAAADSKKVRDIA